MTPPTAALRRVAGGAVAALLVGLTAVVGGPPAQAVPAPYLVAEGLDGALGAPITLGNRLFWVAYGNSLTPSQDSDLWTSDGTAAGTVEFVDPNPGGDSGVNNLTAFQGGFVFTADDGSHGQELWYSDGTEDGTAMVADLAAEPALTHLVGVTSGAVYVAADDGTHGDELYRWTGTGAPTLLEVNPTPKATDVEDLQGEWKERWADAFPDARGVIGDTLVFSAEDTTRTEAQDEWGDWYVAVSGHGRELWSVTTAGSPQLLKDITPEDGFGEPDPEASTTFDRSDSAVLGGYLYFVVNGSEDFQTVPDLWRTNGTAGGTALAAHDLPVYWDDNRDQWNFEPAVAGGKLFYAGWDRSSFEYDGLWASTGAGAGSRVSPAGDAGRPTALGSSVVFSLNQPGTGTEPWVSDGTTSSLLLDVRSGTAGSVPFPFLSWEGHAYFGAGVGAGRNLFRTDGTAAGTGQLYDLPNEVGAIVDGPVAFTGADDVLYFFNSPDDDRTAGNELWAFDPNRTAAATPTVKLSAPSPIAYGTGPQVTITVSGSVGTPTGSVTLKDGTTTLGSANLSSGKAVIALPKTLSVGTHQLVATYSGDGSYDAASSVVVKVVVKAATKLAGRISDLTYTTTQYVRVAGTLKTTPAIRASGTVTVLVDGKKKVAKVMTAANNNTVSFAFRGLTVGRHKIQLTFTSSPNAMNAKTGTVTITVVKP